ncbi:MAG: hypothetical protein ACRC8S_03495 [Fimbriiglobus sp.]
MAVWLREIMGWVLLGTGLAAFAVCYFVFLLSRRIVEAVGLGIIGITIFRGGMGMLRVSMAARAARELDAQPKMPEKPLVKPTQSISMPGKRP